MLMNMKNCFITGGTGFIGSHIVKLLVKRGHQVTVLIRKTSNLSLIQGLQINTITCDLTDSDSLISMVPEDTEWLFHNAAVMSHWGNRSKFWPVNVEGTRNILEIVRKKDIPQLIHTSSTAIYGLPNKIEPIKEDDPWHPENAYQESKAAAEQLVIDYERDYGIKAVRVRPPTVVGHGDMFTGPQIIERIKNNSMVAISGESRTSFVHAEDVARCLILSAERFNNAHGKAYNVVSFICTFRDLLIELARELGVNTKFRTIPYHLALFIGKISVGFARLLRREQAPAITDFVVKIFGTNYIINADRAREELGFEPKWDLQSTAKDMVKWGGFVKQR